MRMVVTEVLADAWPAACRSGAVLLQAVCQGAQFMLCGIGCTYFAGPLPMSKSWTASLELPVSMLGVVLPKDFSR